MSAISLEAARKLAAKHQKDGVKPEDSAKLLHKAGFVSTHTGGPVSSATIQRLRRISKPKKLVAKKAASVKSKKKAAKKVVGKKKAKKAAKKK